MATNRIVNGGYNKDLTNWTSVTGTNTASNTQKKNGINSLKCVSGAGGNSYVSQAYTMAANHIWYWSFWYYCTVFAAGSYIFAQIGDSASIIASPTMNAWTRWTVRANNANVSTPNAFYIGLLGGVSTVYIDDFVAYDLTGDFGAGSEPTAAICDTTLPSIYPDIQHRIGGAIKTYQGGWVRVGGSLKLIQGVWIRVGGALKQI